jgi:hypothetical protein
VGAFLATVPLEIPVGGNVGHGDGSLEALRAGEIVECLGVW